MRKIVLILLAVSFLLAGYFLFRWYRMDKTPKMGDVNFNLDEKIKADFKYVEIPDDFTKVELKPTEGKEGFGVAAKKFEDGQYEMTILANLSDPDDGQKYKAVLVGNGKELTLGNLELGKGGYILNFDSSTDYSGYKVKILLKSDIVLEE